MAVPVRFYTKRHGPVRHVLRAMPAARRV